MSRSEKGKQQGDAQKIRPIIRPWAKQFRQFRGKWPTFGQIRDGLNLLRGPGTITDKSQSAINKFMTDCRKHEREVGDEAFLPQTYKPPKIKPPKLPNVKAGEPDEERRTINTNLTMCRTLVDMCYQQTLDGNPDFHGFTKIVAEESKLARRSDELVHESRRAAKTPQESRLAFTAHLSTVDQKRAASKKAKKAKK